MKRAVLVFFGVVLLTPCLQAQTPDQKKATLAYVQKLQNKDGGFAPGAGSDQSSLRATNAALRVFKYFDGEVPNKAACSKFVEACYDKSSGSFADMPGDKPDVATTAVGLMAVVELKMPREAYEKDAVNYLSEHAKSFDEIRIAVAGLEAVAKKSPQTDAWIETVKKTANSDGTYGKSDGIARDTGGATAALLRMGAKVDKDAVVKTLNTGQRPDGGFGQIGAKVSDLESCYRVVRCYHMLKSKPDVDKMTTFVASCRNDDGGYGVTPGAKSTIAATYYATIILHWLAEK
jgi:prenyltransferase beta subunit